MHVFMETRRIYIFILCLVHNQKRSVIDARFIPFYKIVFNYKRQLVGSIPVGTFFNRTLSSVMIFGTHDIINDTKSLLNFSPFRTTIWIMHIKQKFYNRLLHFSFELFMNITYVKYSETGTNMVVPFVITRNRIFRKKNLIWSHQMKYQIK